MMIVILAMGVITAYINGMHDGGSISSCSICARLVEPRKALVLSGLANFLGALILGTAVARTIGLSLIRPAANTGQLTGAVVIAAFLGGLVWNLLTWMLGLPSSSSHSMIGALIGSSWLAFGVQSVCWMNILIKVLLAMLISPVLGFAAGFLLLKLEHRLLRNATMEMAPWVKRINLLVTLLLSLTYGSSDTQKVAGLTALGLAALSGQPVSISLPIMALLGAALALGTITGGFNMIGTIGRDIVRLDMDKAFISELASLLVLQIANITGLPVSCTQIITGTVMGAGCQDSPARVHWSIARRIGLAWILTFPASAAMGALAMKLLLLTGIF